MSGGAFSAGNLLCSGIWACAVASVSLSADTLEFDKNDSSSGSDFSRNYIGVLHKSDFYENCAKNNLIFLNFLRII